ncbi:hypothetical protein DPMN_066753 [Dreissena polymorpha]|uniref:Uncharacterized protein n=1 Tax=Dreissena polymorpha TaxID=45954 RepID=A0A9D3YY09_DREPO|nr:hypothetical protein DPMN_066753 [Dreissena polymorpha]
MSTLIDKIDFNKYLAFEVKDPPSTSLSVSLSGVTGHVGSGDVVNACPCVGDSSRRLFKSGEAEPSDDCKKST